MERRSENVDLVENGNVMESEIRIAVDVGLVVENGCVIWTHVDLGVAVKNEGDNRGPKWWAEPCSVYEPRPLFSLPVWLQPTEN